MVAAIIFERLEFIFSRLLLYIDSICNLISPQCNSVNEIGLFNNTKRFKRSHGHRSNNKPIIHHVSFASLLPYVNKQLGLHYICTNLYSHLLKVENNHLEKFKESSILDFHTRMQTLMRALQILLIIGHKILRK